MTIVGIYGSLGSGKTLLMVCLAYINMLKGRTVYSNFGLKGAKDIDRITDIRQLTNCIILIDDIIAWLDSRQASSNVFITHLLMASRKKGLDIYYSSQIETGSDIRLRVITDIHFYTDQIEFPSFNLEIWIGYRNATDSEFIGEFVITYKEEVYSLYDTLEVAYQQITMKEINTLLQNTRKKELFTLILNVKYNIMKVNGKSIFDLLYADIEQETKTEYLIDILAKEGYILV